MRPSHCLKKKVCSRVCAKANEEKDPKTTSTELRPDHQPAKMPREIFRVRVPMRESVFVCKRKTKRQCRGGFYLCTGWCRESKRESKQAETYK